MAIIEKTVSSYLHKKEIGRVAAARRRQAAKLAKLAAEEPEPVETPEAEPVE
jgi:hypothetical protein